MSWTYSDVPSQRKTVKHEIPGFSVVRSSDRKQSSLCKPLEFHQIDRQEVLDALHLPDQEVIRERVSNRGVGG